MPPTEYYACTACGALNVRDVRCPCGGPDKATRRKRGGFRWWECECGHVGNNWLHCGTSYPRQGSQGEFRRALLQYRDGPGCQGCGATERLTLDHKVPRSKRGKNHLGNLWVLCADCNRDKADMSVAEWLEKRSA